MALLSLEHVTKGFEDRILLSEVDLVLEDSERVGLVGRNGCGKSTLLSILAGRLAPRCPSPSSMRLKPHCRGRVPSLDCRCSEPRSSVRPRA